MASSSADVIIPAKRDHSATVIFLHGLGDTGHGWSPVFEREIRRSHVKYICPTAPVRPVTLNMGMRMPAWFDLYGLDTNSREDEEGIKEQAAKMHRLIDAEINAGIPSDRIVIGGFSMGGALALYSALTYDKPLAGVVGLSTFLVLRNQLPGSHTANRQVKIFQAHGDSDPLVAPVFAHATFEALKRFNSNVQFKTYAGMGHSACEAELKDVDDFLQSVIPPKK